MTKPLVTATTGEASMTETTEQRLTRLEQFQDRLVAASEALAAVLGDPMLVDYAPRSMAYRLALNWLEMDSTCGDCLEGRCHYEPGVVSRCGCSFHDVSVRVRQRRAHTKTTPRSPTKQP
jgi:hypothetical protein